MSFSSKLAVAAIALATGSAFASPVLSLSVTPRYNSPAVTNNGAGVFTVQAGAYGAGDNLALWNYNYSATGGGFGTAYRLLVDFDEAKGNAVSTYTDMSWLLLGGTTNSENFGFFTNYKQFDPTESGEYGVVLEAYNVFTGKELGRSSILVEVGTVPEPASIALVATALAGLGFASRRRAR